MKTIKDYSNSFDAILEFESAVAKYTGAAYCVTTDCCSHAIEIAFRLTFDNSNTVTFPARTYLSVPMTLHKLGIPYSMTDDEWLGEYEFKGSRVWDCARRFEPNMYRAGTVQCISFGRTKPLQIERGGCLLTDNYQLYKAASEMRMDGRDIFEYSPWITQQRFTVGYHYYMRPEECVRGFNMLLNKEFTEQLPEYYNYPDCRTAEINDYKKIAL
jgi:dTDP-4-amino-4,6-dideoxygalactose transaminase